MSNTMLTLTSKDNETFTIEQDIAIQSVTIKNLVDDDCASNTIPLPNVDSKTLSMVIEFLKKQFVSADMRKQAAVLADLKEQATENDNTKKNDLLKQAEQVEKEQKTFVKEFAHDYPTLFAVILAANYLDIKALLDISCQEAADRITGKTPEEVREIFNIINDYTPEEEEETRNEYPWAYE